MGDTVLRLVPSNWFYNLSVYGFLRILEYCFRKQYASKKIFLLEEIKGLTFSEDGSIIISKTIFDSLSRDCLIEGLKKIAFISPFGRQKAYFSNTKESSKTFTEKIDNLLSLKANTRGKKANCFLCFEIVNTKYKLNSAYGKLFPVKKEDFPNNYWNLNAESYLCPICAGLAYFHICGFIKIKNKVGVFVNAPSFKLIWRLNNHIAKIHVKDNFKDIKTLFGLSFINLAIDLNLKLGIWQRLSTEIITLQQRSKEQSGKRKVEWEIDFYEIPPQILELLEDKRVSSLLVELSNLKLLEVFMSGNFKLFEVLIHRLLRNAESNKDDELLKEFGLTYSPYKVKTLSKLYALIVSKLKKPAEVGV